MGQTQGLPVAHPNQQCSSLQVLPDDENLQLSRVPISVEQADQYADQRELIMRLAHGRGLDVN